MNVLILEDSKSRQRDFRSNLPWATIVETAESCIKRLQKEDWDLVFLDHDLGGEIYVDATNTNTGSEVVRWICGNNPKIKKIVVHSLNDEAAYHMVVDLKMANYDAEAIPFMCLEFELYQAMKYESQT